MELKLNIVGWSGCRYPFPILGMKVIALETFLETLWKVLNRIMREVALNPFEKCPRKQEIDPKAIRSKGWIDKKLLFVLFYSSKLLMFIKVKNHLFKDGLKIS